MELVPHLGWDAGAQKVEVAGVVLHVSFPFLGVDGESGANILDIEVDAFEIDILGAGGVAHDGFFCLDVAFDAINDCLLYTSDAADE